MSEFVKLTITKLNYHTNLNRLLWKVLLNILLLVVVFSGLIILSCTESSDEIPNYKARRCFQTLYLLYDNQNNNNKVSDEKRIMDMSLLAILCRETIGKREKEREKNRFSPNDLPP